MESGFWLIWALILNGTETNITDYIVEKSVFHLFGHKHLSVDQIKIQP